MAKPAALDELDTDELLTEEVEIVELIDDEFELIAEEIFELICAEELELTIEEELELVTCAADDFDEPDDEPPPHACRKTPSVKIATGNDIAFIINTSHLRL